MLLLPSTIFIYTLVISRISSEGAPILFPPYDFIEGNSTEIDCPELGKINNGKVIVQRLNSLGKVAIITCDRGYDIEGNKNVYCMKGQWQFFNALPRCIKPRCLPPPQPNDGKFDIEGKEDDEGYYPKGTVVSYSCSEGYDLIPETSRLRVCEKGIWTGPIASCIPNVVEVPGCPPVKAIPYGYFIVEKSGDLGSSFGQKLNYNCKTGYELVGHRVQECLEDGSWLPKTQPTCLPKRMSGAIPCGGLLTAPYTATEIIQQADGGTMADVTVEVRCLGMYRNSKNPCRTAKLRCVAGKWIGQVPLCVPAHECLAPPAVAYATIVDVNYNLYDSGNPTGFPIKSTVTYQCLQGFVMESEPVLSCELGGCWSPADPPICVRERAPPVRQSTGDSFFLEVDNINAILMSAAAGAGVLGILLLICLMVACRRKKQHSTTVAIPQPIPRQDMGDHAALLEHPDRLALIAFADGVQRNQNLLPSYDEAIRNERGASLTAARPHRPHWPNLAGRRNRNSPNPDAGHVTRHGSFASHTPSTRSAGDSMGSTDTVAVSEGSTNVTLDTASSHSGSQPASCRAHCGSLASFDACSVVNTEDVPLLEESELEEIQGGTNDMENPAISENSSLKISTNSADILSV